MIDRIPPSEITLVYRPVGAGHVFTAEGMPGFYIGSSSMKNAFGLAIKGISEHVSELCNQTVTYCTDMTFAEFQNCVESESLMANFLLARRKDGVRQTEKELVDA